MTFRAFLLISAGAILGANARYLVALVAATRWGLFFPWGTLIINVTGSFAMGLLVAVVSARFDNRPDARLILATGFLGSYTTFSTYAFETLALGQRGDYALAVGNALGSVVLGVGAAALGFVVGQAVAR